MDEEYCISFVYRGNFQRVLTQEGIRCASESTLQRDSMGLYFVDTQPDATYRLEVIEDPIAGVGAEGLRTYSSPIKVILSPTYLTVKLFLL